MRITKLEMPDGTLTKIEGGLDADVDRYINNHYRKVHHAANREYQAEVVQQPSPTTNFLGDAPLPLPGPETNFGEPGVLPLPTMVFDSPASQKPAPAPAFVGNAEPVLPLPRMF